MDLLTTLKHHHNTTESGNIDRRITVEGSKISNPARRDNTDLIPHADCLSGDAGGGDKCLSGRKANTNQQL